MTKMAGTLLRMGQLKLFRQFTAPLRRICVPATAENKSEKLPKAMRRKLKEEGIQRHAIYHIKVKELAADFRLKRLEEEKHLNAEEQKHADLRQLEKEMHERVIESIKLENQRMAVLR